MDPVASAAATTTNESTIDAHDNEIESPITYCPGEEEQDDSEFRNDEVSKHHTTRCQTYLHLLKGYVGPGCLSLPWAFSLLGIPLGFFTTIILSVLTSYNSYNVVQIKKKYLNRRGITYSDLGELGYGPKFRIFVSASVAVQQLAICTVFLSFIGENLSAVIQYSSGVNFDHRIIITLVFPLAMFLSCLPNLRVLAPVTAWATVLLFLGFVLIGVVIVDRWVNNGYQPENIPISPQWGKLPLAVCAIMYSYEGINLILPIETAMQKPSKFNTTFLFAMSTVCTIFCVTATICVVAFGFVNDGSITAFLLMNGDRYGNTVVNIVYAANAAVSLSVLLTYPLQIYPCIVLVSQMIARRSVAQHSLLSAPNLEFDLAAANVPKHDAIGINFIPLRDDIDDNILSTDVSVTDEVATERHHHTLSEKSDLEGDSSLMRAILVSSTYIVAISIPNVQELISLAGALSGSSTALIIPPLLELRYTESKWGWGAIKCYFLVLIGVVFGVVGTVASVDEIVKSY